MIARGARIVFKFHLRRTAAVFLILALLLLCPWRISQGQALVVSLTGLVLIIIFATTLGQTAWKRVKQVLSKNQASRQAGQLIIKPGDNLFLLATLISRTGIAPLGLIFLIVWALIYMMVFALGPCPDCSFYGAKSQTAISEFFYLSVNLAVANPPPTIYPISTLAKAASSLEVFSGLAAITLSAGAFFGANRDQQNGEEETGNQEPGGAVNSDQADS